MRVIILGSRGQLGSALQRRMPQAVGLARPECDVTQPQIWQPLLESLRPDWLINCTAYTQVDQAEAEPEQAQLLNTVVPAQLADWCQQTGCRLLHMSTDYVFGSEVLPDRPRTETDPTGPLSVYGSSKLAGEEQILQCCPDALIVRTCGLYGSATRPSFVRTMLRLGRAGKSLRVVEDQTCSPTWVDDLASGLQQLLPLAASGILHLTNTGGISWYEFARRLFEQARVTVDLQPISSAEYAAPAQRPRYSVLNTNRFADLTGHPLPTITSALTTYLSTAVDLA